MSELIIDAVRSRYGAIAKSGLSRDHDKVRAVAEAFGYAPEELASIPTEANMALPFAGSQAERHRTAAAIAHS